MLNRQFATVVLLVAGSHGLQAHRVVNAGCPAEWMPLSGEEASHSSIRALLTWDSDGVGPEPETLLVGGNFTVKGISGIDHVAVWDGVEWSILGDAFNDDVTSLATLDDGSGPALYAGGLFTQVGPVAVNRIARWNGLNWEPLGDGIEGASFFTGVYALASFDDGTGPLLYVGGLFDGAGDIPASGLATWDGSKWSDVADLLGMDEFTSALSLKVFDDGSGPALFIGGIFTSAGGVAANNIAKWDGSLITALSGGTNGGVLALEELTVGEESALYAGGSFTSAAGAGALRIARWAKGMWSAVGTGIAPNVPSGVIVRCLSVFNDGTGESLFAGGSFGDIGGSQVSHVAEWNGSAWRYLGGWPTDNATQTVMSLAAFDDGSGEALFVASWTELGSGPADPLLRRWRCLCPHCDTNSDGAVLFKDWKDILNCLSGPAAPLLSGCSTKRLDAGKTIDLADVAWFQREYGRGANLSNDCCTANSTPGCSDLGCLEAVCSCDSFCCEVQWDDGCAESGFLGNGCGARELCAQLCAPCVISTNSCCAVNATPGCNNSDCCTAVCACDSFCCDSEWDEGCATTGYKGSGCGAQLVCPGLCTP